MAPRDEISEAELRNRVIYALMLPAVRVANHFEIPLKEMKRWVETAYYDEVHSDEMTVREAADRLDVSTSKISLLSRQLKENFLRPELEDRIERRIEFMLWAEPLSLARIQQVLTDVSDADVEQAVETLLEDDRVRVDDSGRTTTYRLNIEASRRTWDSWLTRIDGLENALSNLADAVFGRFFRDEDRALARTLTFRIPRDAHEELRKFYEERLFPFVEDLDERADADDDPLPMSLSMVWAPYRYLLERRWRDD